MPPMPAPVTEYVPGQEWAVLTGSLLAACAQNLEAAKDRWYEDYWFVNEVYVPENCAVVAYAEVHLNSSSVDGFLTWLAEDGKLFIPSWSVEEFATAARQLGMMLVDFYDPDELSARATWLLLAKTSMKMGRVITSSNVQPIFDGVTVDYWYPA